MDKNTLENFNNIQSETTKARLKALINTINSNQGLYDRLDEEIYVGDEVWKLNRQIRDRSQRRREWNENRSAGDFGFFAH